MLQPITNVVPTRIGDDTANSLARRALLTADALAMAGSILGVVGMVKGTVVGTEIPLILSCLLFSCWMLVTLLVFRTVAVQTVATVAMAYFTIYLCACSITSITSSGHHGNLFIYLVWFSPLVVFNKLVNEPAVGRFFAKSLFIAPLLIVLSLSPRLIAIFNMEMLLLLVAWSFSHVLFGLMFDVVTRYREDYIVERERAESLKIKSMVLESISDCFIALDSSSKLVYLNDAACTEFSVEQTLALNHTLLGAVPALLSESMLEGLRAASGASGAGMFEAQNKAGDRWYEVRCFPSPDGLSIYFRNITESMSSRLKLDAAHSSLREQAELLDKAQDAILVQDMDRRILYGNKSAERLYGWTASEVMGRCVEDVLRGPPESAQLGIASVLKDGEWGGELLQWRRDGTTLTVESRCTLVCGDEGNPRSILSINTDITNRKGAEAKIQRLAFYDVLTSLPNRTLLRERLDMALASAVRQDTMGALLFIDLDDFKTLNDTWGHDAGDLLLQQVALRLTACVRDGDTVARLGGDEFVVMLEGLRGGDDAAAARAKAVGDHILEAFLRPYHVGNSEYTSTGSIGITIFPGWSNTTDDLLKRADMAMYRAKAQGRNKMCFFDPAMQTMVASRAALQADLRRTLQNREFELYYQPQVNRGGQVTGAEALLRWRHPDGSFVPPIEFIPAAEEAGLIIELGRWALEKACFQLAEWAACPELDGISISVNVCMRQFLDSHFVNLVRDVLRQTGANPRKLKLEITESSLMENVEEVIAKMMALRVHGVRFSLDDFGTGYSSLNYLKRLPLDQLKIDRSFIADVLTNPKDASIARTIITLGKNLSLSVIAEGVETEEQRDFLEGEGCYSYQGYLFSPAVPASLFEEFVAAKHRRENHQSQDLSLVFAG